MFSPVMSNILYAMTFVVIGAAIGSFFVLMATGFIHRIADNLTPHIDESKEILRGNVAVAEYFGRVVSACIMGVSLVVSAAVLAGILSALHG